MKIRHRIFDDGNHMLVVHQNEVCTESSIVSYSEVAEFDCGNGIFFVGLTGHYGAAAGLYNRIQTSNGEYVNG